MSARTIRVNARLTGEDARRFEELRDREQWSATDVIRETVREYYKRTGKPRKSAWEIMSKSGLIGALKGAPTDLSTNKKYLDDHYTKKSRRQPGAKR